MENHFDIAILGTGLTESILAAALSKAGLKVVHVDEPAYYGGNEASLTIDEMENWVEAHRETHAAVSEGTLPLGSRAFSLSLAPSILPATGPLINALIQSGVSRYTSFKLLDDSAIWNTSSPSEGEASSSFRPVPTSKAGIFSSSLSLPQRRRLMRLIQTFMPSPEAPPLQQLPELIGKHNLGILEFLTQPLQEGGGFALDREVAEGVAYALGFCESASDKTLPVLQRMQSYLGSAGRYGDSPFLIGHYGGLGEIAQGFCRMAAVHGAAYILGHRIISVSHATEPTDLSIDLSEHPWSIELDDVPGVLHAKLLVTSPAHAHHWQLSPNPPSEKPKEAISNLYCIAVIPARDADATSLRIFPPSSTSQHDKTVTALVTGSDTMACPSEYNMIYMTTKSLPSTAPGELLRPYLHHMNDNPTYAVYFSASSNIDFPSDQSDHQKLLLTVPLADNLLTEVGDACAADARRLFWAAVKLLDTDVTAIVEDGEMWPPREDLNEDYD